jgi:uncharacterized protein YqeY
MLADEIKARMLAAMKAGRSVEKEVLRVALGEIQTTEARTGKMSDDEAAAIVRKLIKSNRETLDASDRAEQRATLNEEIAILESLLPKSLGPEELAEALAPVADAIRNAGNDGQATGIAMKALKAQGKTVDGKVVAVVVKTLRGG